MVFHARDAERDRQEVAVKVLLKDTEEDRFQREAEKLSDLSHPNVVSFLEIGHHDGRDFLVMEYLSMGDLTSYIKSLNVVAILRLFIEICDGLAHLHDRGIVHRDIKPANILVGADGRPKITDLGVARQMERNTRLTQAGTILGTYSYLAPEQILSSSVGPRADIYSLGICLFYALPGRKPFEAENEFKMLKAHLEEPPPSLKEYLPEAPDSLEELLNRMLAKDENDRPRSARLVADGLQQSIEDLESQNQEDLESAWEERIEELPEDQRSVLLAITYLGREATFERVCQATPFAEDRTDRCLEALLENRLIDSPTDDRFSLRVPEETIATRLTPRLRKLFAQRISALSDSRETAVEPDDEPTTLEEPGQEDPTETSGQPPAEEPEPEPEEVSSEPVPPPPAPSEPEDSARATPPQPDVAEVAPEKLSEKKPRWGLISLLMLILGVGLAGGVQWYYNHSAAITISSIPSGAHVELNGRDVGVTPLTARGLGPGIQALEVTLDGHKTQDDQIEIGFMQNQEVHYSLEPRVGKLLLTAKPRDASVSIDDKVYGAINSDLTLSAGKHHLKVTKDGFLPYESELQIEDEGQLEVDATLTPIVAELKITSEPEGAEVSVDGKDRGKTPVTVKKLPYGSHEIAVRMMGHDRVNKTVEVKSDKPMDFHAKLAELPGALLVTSEPKGAKVKLNGQLKGKTPQNLTGLKAGTYTLTLSKDGYQVSETKKAVKAGEETKAHINLAPVVVSRPNPPPVSRPPTYRPPPPAYRPPPVTRPRPPANPTTGGGSGGNPWIVE